MSGASNFSLICIYCNFPNQIARIKYWLSSATHRFRLSSNSGQGIKTIIFFLKDVDLGGL